MHRQATDLPIGEDLGKIADDYMLQYMLDKLRNQNRVEIFFDASDVIKLIQGILALDTGTHIDPKQFHNPSTLVFSFAYKGLLGKIHLLPPHLEELLDKMRESRRLFPERPSPNHEEVVNDFWCTVQLDELVNRPYPPSKKELKNFVGELKPNLVKLFKGSYLIRNYFWQDRYRFLFKDRDLIKVAQFENEYKISQIPKSDLFSVIRYELNRMRPRRIKNNYMDAFALCMLQERLEKYKTTKGKSPLPLLYSNQQAILDVVKLVSDKGRKQEDWFTFQETNGSRYQIVRDARYFIVDGIFNKQDSHKLRENFHSFLQEIHAGQHQKILLEDQKDPLSKINQSELSRQLRENHSIVIDRFFVEFFNRWWESEGYLDLHKSIIEHKKNLKKAVFASIKKDQKELEKKFRKPLQQFSLYRKTMDALADLWREIQRNQLNWTSEIDVHKELGARFALSQTQCRRMQEVVDELLEAAIHQDDKEVFNSVVADLINQLVTGVVENEIDELMCGLGILWIFQKYELICLLGERIRRQQEEEKQKEEYPNYQIALLHAASLLAAFPDKLEEAKDIIDCIENKFDTNKYPLLNGLSLLYYLIWLQEIDGKFLPEQIPGEKKTAVLSSPAYNWLHKGIRNANAAIEWLEPRRNKDPDKRYYRHLRYYYAVNNLIFFKTFLAPRADFKEIEQLSRSFSQVQYNQQFYWQNRFHDTLAWYYLRQALWTETEYEFNRWLDFAEEENKRSIKYSWHLQRDYDLLKRNLAETRMQGFEKAKAGAIE